MDLSRAFVFHRENYDHVKRIDDRTSHLMRVVMSILCYIAYYTGLSYIIQALLLIYLKGRRIDDAIVCFLFTRNHEIVRNHLYELGMIYPAYDFTFGRSVQERSDDVYISRFTLFFATLVNAKQYINMMKMSSEDEVIRNNTFKVFKLSGYQFLFQELLRNSALVIKFNDHIYNSMMLFQQCESMNIKTVYIQHAPVSSRFPALHHDLNVLFSDDSREKYRNLTPPRDIFTFFDIRMREAEKYVKNRKEKSNSVLLAANILDDIKQIELLLVTLSSRYKVILRPHPRDNRDFKKFESKTIQISIGRTIWEDLNETEMVICNESAVPLEALYYDRLLYKAAFLSKSTDAYGFLAKGLIKEEFYSIETLMDALASKRVSTDNNKLHFYIGNVADYEGATEKLRIQLESLLT